MLKALKTSADTTTATQNMIPKSTSLRQRIGMDFICNRMDPSWLLCLPGYPESRIAQKSVLGRARSVGSSQCMTAQRHPYPQPQGVKDITE